MEVFSSYSISIWVFIRLLGIVYSIAFGSMFFQIRGLVGEQGILPVKGFLENVQRAAGKKRFYYFPTLAWFFSSDRALQLFCAIGVGLALLLVADYFSVFALLLLWVLYLSLVVICQDFTGFQWDTLLLEVTMLTFFILPWRIGPSFSIVYQPPMSVGIFLLWYLLFRLMLSSGAVKLLAGDTNWRTLAALKFHYETQPIPHWVSWFVHKLPLFLHKFSVAATLCIELVVPFFIFGPRTTQLVACILFLFLQLLIFSTGNFAFFNILTAALCILLIDNQLWKLLFPIITFQQMEFYSSNQIPILDIFFFFAGGCFFLLASCKFLTTFVSPRKLPRFAQRILKWVAPWHIVSTYGLFAIMTTTRPEIIIEGSMEGEVWEEYEFRWKPGKLTKRPAWIAPFQPRLDWQMWFAALGSYQDNPWFVQLVFRLLEGSSDVENLVGRCPFSSPPAYIRAKVYEYRFTNFATLRRTRRWWERTYQQEYLPIVSLNDFEKA